MGIPEHETLSIEFKSDRKTIAEGVIVDEVVALSNTDGGELYIGVEDDGVPTGAQPQHRDPLQMNAMIANKTVPSVSVRTTILTESGKPVVRIEVPRSASVIASAQGRILRRRLKANGEPESIPMYPYEISTRLSDLGRLDYSAQPVPDTAREDFDPVARENLRNMVGKYNNSDKTLLELNDEELEKALGFTTTVAGRIMPTLTGLLMIGREDVLAKAVPTSEAALQVLVGTDVKVNLTYKGSLLRTIEDIAHAIKPWNPVTEVSLGLFTSPVETFNGRAIREALVNAFGHRDYSMLGRVRVLIDDMGLTISNPGGFIEGISIDNLLTADPHGRNPCLMDALKRVGLAERTGRGIDRIYEGSLLVGKPLPDYSESGPTSVNLFIARSEPDQEFIRLIAEESEKRSAPLPLQTLLVLDALKRQRRATIEVLSRTVDVRKSQLVQVVELLVESGLVEAVGSAAHREYRLSSKVYKRSGQIKEYVRQADIDSIRYPELIMRLARKQGQVSKRDVAELLHVGPDTAYYEIRKLVKSGDLLAAKRGPDAYYVPCV